MIEDIERVDTRLQAITLPHLKDPAQGDIEIHGPGAAQSIASEGTVGADRIRLKCRGIEPLDACRGAVVADRVGRPHVREHLNGPVVIEPGE